MKTEKHNNQTEKSAPWAVSAMLFSMLLALVAMGFHVTGKLSMLNDNYGEVSLDHATYDRRSIVTGCNSTTCKPPDCMCASYTHPGQFPVREVPMMVMLTFDDTVHPDKYPSFQRIMDEGLVNPNKCPMKMTFFVSGEYENYTLTRQLYDLGHEIGSHSQTHRFPVSWWSEASQADLEREFQGQRLTISERAGIPESDIRGMRCPFLEIGGDEMFKAAQQSGFTYDSSIVGLNKLAAGERPLWPYTLDFPPTAEMHTDRQKVPNGSYPGLWEIPLARYNCQEDQFWMLDKCGLSNKSNDVTNYLRQNFLSFYRSRTPMGVFMHETWFHRNTGSLEGLLEFLREITAMPDVWLLTVGQVVDWMRSPTAISNIGEFSPWNC